MYNETKTAEDVLEYLYEQKKPKLAKAVVDMIRVIERPQECTHPLIQADEARPLNPTWVDGSSSTFGPNMTYCSGARQ